MQMCMKLDIAIRAAAIELPLCACTLHHTVLVNPDVQAYPPVHVVCLFLYAFFL